MRVVGLAGVAMLWAVLSIETYDFFVVRGNLSLARSVVVWCRQFSVLVTWGDLH